MEARATAKMIRIAPRKTRLVVDLIRGKQVEEALAILEYTNKKASPAVTKVVKSAASNAVNNYSMDAEKLIIKEVYVDEGPTLKRYIAKAKGSGAQILKRTSHITVVVSEDL